VSADEIRALLIRGDSLIAKGDVASARLFYERAAEAGDGEAALRLGESYDPAFLARAHLSGVRGDALAAARWYRRAHELGTIEAETLLRTIEPGKDQRLP
jgi:TPR repeat protein